MYTHMNVFNSLNCPMPGFLMNVMRMRIYERLVKEYLLEMDIALKYVRYVRTLD